MTVEMRTRPSLPFSAGFGEPQTLLYYCIPVHPRENPPGFFFFFFLFSLILKVVSLSKSASPTPWSGAVWDRQSSAGRSLGSGPGLLAGGH